MLLFLASLRFRAPEPPPPVVLEHDPGPPPPDVQAELDEVFGAPVPEIQVRLVGTGRTWCFECHHEWGCGCAVCPECGSEHAGELLTLRGP